MERRKICVTQKIGHDEIFVRTKTEESGGVWDLVG